MKTELIRVDGGWIIAYNEHGKGAYRGADNYYARFVHNATPFTNKVIANGIIESETNG